MLILSNNPSRATVGTGHVSHRRAPACNDHLDHCLIVLRKFTTKRFGGKVRRSEGHINLSLKQQPSEVKDFVFVRPLGYVSHCVRIAPCFHGLNDLRGDEM